METVFTFVIEVVLQLIYQYFGKIVLTVVFTASKEKILTRAHKVMTTNAAILLVLD